MSDQTPTPSTGTTDAGASGNQPHSRPQHRQQKQETRLLHHLLEHKESLVRNRPSRKRRLKSRWQNRMDHS